MSYKTLVIVLKKLNDSQLQRIYSFTLGLIKKEPGEPPVTHPFPPSADQ